MASRTKVSPDTIRHIVEEASTIAMAAFARAGGDLQVWDKVPGEPVSETDLAVDNFLRERLGALVPDAGWLAEETDWFLQCHLEGIGSSPHGMGTLLCKGF